MPGADPKDLFFAIETDRIFRIPAVLLAEAQQRQHEGVFMYRFDWKSPAMGGALGACHAIELPFVFGQLGQEGAEMFVGKGPAADRLSEQTMDAWLAFARSGDPSHAGLPGGRWPAYEPERRETVCLGTDTACDADPADAERRVWEGLL